MEFTNNIHSTNVLNRFTRASAHRKKVIARIKIFSPTLGTLQGISAASQGEIYVNWAPPSQRTLFASSSFTGFALGAIFTYPLAGYVTNTLNWEYTFYITGNENFRPPNIRVISYCWVCKKNQSHVYNRHNH